jgi:hypothetical protein
MRMSHHLIIGIRDEKCIDEWFLYLAPASRLLLHCTLHPQPPTLLSCDGQSTQYQIGRSYALPNQ